MPQNQTKSDEILNDFNDFVRAAKAWAKHLDQWDKIKFPTDHGMVYVTVSRSDPYPYSFDEV